MKNEIDNFTDKLAMDVSIEVLNEVCNNQKIDNMATFSNFGSIVLFISARENDPEYVFISALERYIRILKRFLFYVTFNDSNTVSIRNTDTQNELKHKSKYLVEYGLENKYIKIKNIDTDYVQYEITDEGRNMHNIIKDQIQNNWHKNEENEV